MLFQRSGAAFLNAIPPKSDSIHLWNNKQIVIVPARSTVMVDRGTLFNDMTEILNEGELYMISILLKRCHTTSKNREQYGKSFYHNSRSITRRLP